MQDVDYKEVLVQYGHIIAITICIAFNAFWYMSSGDSEAEELIKDLNDTKKKIKLAQKKAELPIITDGAYKEIVEENWNKQATISEITPNYTSIYPSADYKAEFEVPPADQWINKPSGIKLDVGREKIKVSWDAPKDLFEEGTNKQKQMTQIAGYQLVKEWIDRDGKPRKKRIPRKINTKSYTDRKVETKVEYSYKVRVYTENTKAKGGKVTKIKGKEVVASGYTEKKKGQIQSLFEVKLQGATSTTAFLKLRKWKKGAWRETSCNIKEGDKIKKMNVRIADLKKPVDFNPGWTLVAVTTKATRLVIRKKNVWDKEIGRMVRKKVKEKKTVFAIIYKDEKGKEIKILGK